MSDKSILLIDDDELLCDLFASLLELEGYHVVKAGNGKAGLAALAQNSFDLIILDLLMPLMDGIVFIRNVPSHVNKIPPILVISASADGAILDQLKTPQVIGVLRKPINPSELLAHVKAALNTARA
jgi:DNA-binding response OmpR family regulator